VSTYSERRIGNWTFEAYGIVLPLPADLANRVKRPVPNRSERRRMNRAIRAETKQATRAAEVTE
jgi:hypothetical protein